MRSGIKFLRHFAVAAFLMLLASCSPEPVKRVKPVPVPVSLHLLCPKNRALEEKLVEHLRNGGKVESFPELPPGARIYPYGSSYVFVEDRVQLGGTDISELHIRKDDFANFLIQAMLSPAGREKLLQFTGQNIGRRVAAINKGRVLVAPSIQMGTDSDNIIIYYTPDENEVKAVYNEILTSD